MMASYMETIPGGVGMEQTQLDDLLAEIVALARDAGVPVSACIDPHVAVNSRARTRFGCCRLRAGRYSIELSAHTLRGGEGAVRRVLAHEVLHTCPGCADHGAQWKRWAAVLGGRLGCDLRRTDTFAALGIEDDRPVRYVAVCTRCGARLTRMKRSPLIEHPERYRCRCGGKFQILSVNNQHKSHTY